MALFPETQAVSRVLLAPAGPGDPGSNGYFVTSTLDPTSLF
jgi:hypothetical protein